MHKLFPQDLSDKALKQMKKRINVYRDTKDNSSSDSFRAIDLNFFENCVDTLIRLKSGGFDTGYANIIKEVYEETESTNNNNGFDLAKAYKLKDAVKGQKYVLWDCKERFDDVFKFFYTVTGGIGGMSLLYIILKDGSVFRCISHGSISETIDSEPVTGIYLGSLSINIDKVLNYPNVHTKMHAMFDAIDYMLCALINGSIVPCVAEGGVTTTPRVDYNFYRGVFNECFDIIKEG